MNGETLHPGDAIRFAVSTDRPSLLTIIGIDAGQQVTPYQPAAGGAARVPAGRGQEIAGSIVLDATTGPEKIIALFCDRQVPVDTIVEAGRAALNDAGGDPRKVGRLGVECRQAALVIEKRLAP